MEIIKDFTEEEALTEFENFIKVLPNTNLYIPSFFQENFDSYKENFDDLMQFINNKEDAETFYLKKIDFVEKDEAGNLFLNKEKFRNKLSDIADKYENYGIIQNMPFEKINKIVDYYSNIYNTTNTAGNAGFILKNKTTDKIFNLNIIFDPCHGKDTSITIYHELCHSLQNSFDIKLEINYINVLTQYNQLKILSKEELQSKDNLALKTKYDKLLFLHKFHLESQANLFAYMIILLQALQKNDLNNFLKIKSCLLYKASTSEFFKGYFDFPTLNNVCIFMEQNPEKYLKDFIKEDNKIDFEKLYFFTREQILERKNTYENFLLKNENLNLYSYFKAVKSTQTERLELEPQYQLLSPIIYEEYFAFLYNSSNRKNYENSIKNNFFNLIHNISLDIEEKDLSLKFLEDKLKFCQKVFSEQNYERIKGCFDTITDKYKEFTIDTTIDK